MAEVARLYQISPNRMEAWRGEWRAKGELAFPSTGRKQGITVVETLAPERYREAHIPGALNIPPEQIKELAPQLLPNKDAEIVTYCTNTH